MTTHDAYYICCCHLSLLSETAYKALFQSRTNLARLLSQRMLVSKFTEVLRAVRSRLAHEYDRTGRASARCASVVLIRRYDRVPLAAPIRLSRWPATVRVNQDELSGVHADLDQLRRLIYDGLWQSRSVRRRAPSVLLPSYRTFCGTSACCKHRDGVCRRRHLSPVNSDARIKT